MADVLVVGAGLSGARICQLLRAQGFAGRVTLVGAEPDLPYDRPPLTSHPDADTDLARTMAIDVRELADEVRLGSRATSLTRLGDDWLLELDDVDPGAPGRGPVPPVTGRTVVIATGAAPVVPAGWGGAGVLHTRAQAEWFWSQVGDDVGLVIVGGGWIGCEAALTAAGRGARVTLLEAGDQVLPGRVPGEVAARVAEMLRGAGVVVALGGPVTAVREARPSGHLVLTDSGDEVRGDLVLAALGVRPDTAWLPEELLRSELGAALTDPWGRTSLPGVFALGDAAARWSPRAGRHLPGGHWTEAFTAPESAAPAVLAWLAGGRDRVTWGGAFQTPAGDPVPYTFSDLGGHRLLVLGDAAPRDPCDVLWRGDAQAWTAYVVVAGRLHGVCALDRPRDVVAARTAMRAAPQGRPWVSTSALTDPAAPPTRTFAIEEST